MNSINLNELSFDNVGQWPKLIKYSLVIFLSFLIIALGYWLIVKSSFDDYSNLQSQEITLKKDFELKQQGRCGLLAGAE